VIRVEAAPQPQQENQATVQPNYNSPHKHRYMRIGQMGKQARRHRKYYLIECRQGTQNYYYNL
jgi:hypothetical protein